MIYKRRKDQSRSHAKAAQHSRHRSQVSTHNAAFTPGRPEGRKPSLEEKAAVKNSQLEVWLDMSRQLSTSSSTDSRKGKTRRSSDVPLLYADVDDDPVEDLLTANVGWTEASSQIPEERALNGVVAKVPGEAGQKMYTAANGNRYAAPEDTVGKQVFVETNGDMYAAVDDDGPRYAVHNPTFVAPAYRKPLNMKNSGSESKTDLTYGKPLNVNDSGSESKTDVTLGRGMLNIYGSESKTDATLGRIMAEPSTYSHLTNRMTMPPVYAESPSYNKRRESEMHDAPEYGEVDDLVPIQPDTYDNGEAGKATAPAPGADVSKSAPVYRVDSTPSATVWTPGEQEYAVVDYSEPNQLDQEEYAIVNYSDVEQVKSAASPDLASSNAALQVDDVYATVDDIIVNRPSAPPPLPGTRPLLPTANNSRTVPAHELGEAVYAGLDDNGGANSALPPEDDSIYATAEVMTEAPAGRHMPSRDLYDALPEIPSAVVSASGLVDGDGAGSVIYSGGRDMYATVDDSPSSALDNLPGVPTDVYATVNKGSNAAPPVGDIYAVSNRKAKPVANLSAEDVYDNGEANSTLPDDSIYATAKVLTEAPCQPAGQSMPGQDLYDKGEANSALPPQDDNIYATAEVVAEAKALVSDPTNPYGFADVSNGVNSVATPAGLALQSATLIGDEGLTYELANTAPARPASYALLPSQTSSTPPLDIPRINGEANSTLSDDSIYATAEPMTEASASRPMPSQDVYDNGEANSALPPQDDSIYATAEVMAEAPASLPMPSQDVYDNGEANSALPPQDDSIYATAEVMAEAPASLPMPSQDVYEPANGGATSQNGGATSQNESAYAVAEVFIVTKESPL